MSGYESRPSGESGAAKSFRGDNNKPNADRRQFRLDAQARLRDLNDLHDWPADRERSGSQDYGMNRQQLQDYGNALAAAGWQPWELAARLRHPSEVAA